MEILYILAAIVDLILFIIIFRAIVGTKNNLRDLVALKQVEMGVSNKDLEALVKFGQIPAAWRHMLSGTGPK